MLDNFFQSLKNKKVTVMGWGKSGQAAAKLLLKFGADVWVTEKDASKKSLASDLLGKKIKHQEFGFHTPGFIEAAEMVITCPGIKPSALPLVWAKERGIPVFDEIELAFCLCPCPIIAITGTNGKTTTTTLTSLVLERTKKKIHTLGNIGTPFCEYVKKIKPEDLVCLEISSFQLSRTFLFHPYVAVFLNIEPDHLDWHPDFSDYFNAKLKIFQNQTSQDWAVLNARDPRLKKISQKLSGRVLFFNEDKNSKLDEDYQAAMKVGEIFSISQPEILEVFSSFKGLPHRLEFVCQFNGVDFINDSKSTTVASTIWAFKNINGPIYLIAGGRDKGDDFNRARDSFSQKIKGLILMGEAKEKIRKSLEGLCQILEANNLEEAVELAYKMAKGKGTVLLSPMCASFDMFRDYEERGDRFKEIVGKMN